MKKLYILALKVMALNWDKNDTYCILAYDDMLCIIDEVCENGFSIIEDPDDAFRAEAIGMKVEWVTEDNNFLYAVAK